MKQTIPKNEKQPVGPPPARSQSTKAEIVDSELERLIKRHGAVTKELVLQVASDPASPLHQFFEWDNGAAAERYRLEQAYRLIQASAYVFLLKNQSQKPVGEPTPHRARGLIPQGRDGEGFRFRRDVLSEEEQRSSFIARKKRELDGWCNSVADIDEFAEVRNMIWKFLHEGEMS